MFLKILKSNPLLALVFPVLVAVLIWGGVFISHQVIAAKSTMPLFNLLFVWLLQMPAVATITGFAILILEAFMWNRFINNESLLKQSSYFPALFFILLFSCRPMQVGLYPTLVASLFLIFGLRRLASSYKKEKALSEAFDAGLCIGMAALLYLPACVFLLFLWISLLTIRSVVWREMVVSFIGYLMPFGFALAYYTIFFRPEDFWYDKVLAALSNYTHPFSFTMQQILLLVVFTAISLLSLFFFLGKVSDNIVKNQKIWTLMLWFVFFGMAAFALAPQKDARALSLLVLPFSFIFSNYFLRARSTWITELLFILLLAAIGVNMFY